MKKKVFLSILVMICFLFGINSVKAKTGKDESGDKTTFLKYCLGDDCRFVVIGIDNDNKVDGKIYYDNGNESDEGDGWANELTIGFDSTKSMKYLHRIKVITTGVIVLDGKHYHYIFSENKSPDGSANLVREDYIKNREIPEGDNLKIGFYVAEKRSYKLLYVYGSDEIGFDETSRIGLKIKELTDETKDIIDKENIPDINYGGGTEGCAILTEPIKKKINWVLDFIKYAGTALAIILGAADFLKATLADDDNASKKAFQKFINRLIAAVLLFLIPLILQFLFTAINNPLIKIPGFNADSPTCGIGVSENE